MTASGGVEKSAELSDTRPLILTLRFDAETFATLDALRRAHFPSERNQLRAHLTLFHHLPGDRLMDVYDALRRTTARDAFPIHFTKLRFLGRGVAFDVASAELTQLRASIAHEFADALTPQDRQKHLPHVTIQNKATPGDARALLETLSQSFAPWHGRAEGLLLWRYLGGPWALEANVPFRPRDVDAGIADSRDAR